MPFFSSLLNRGQSYHMWFRLYDDGDLSGGSLSEADHRRLHGQTAVPASPPHYLPHLYPPPSQHSTAGLHLSVRPHLEGYLGFFLMGYLLGHYSPGRRMRAVIYCGGVIGYLWGRSGQSLDLVSQAGPSALQRRVFSESLSLRSPCSCSVKTVCTHHERDLRPLEKMLASASNLVFGVYGYTC